MQSVAAAYKVSAMPTFVFLKNNGATKVDLLRGADPKKLEAAIVKHLESSPSSLSLIVF